MLLGAYTIINTLGLLVGLPYNTQSTIQGYQIDINNNFYDYVSNNHLIEENFNTNIGIIIDFNSNTSIDGLTINLSNKLFDKDSFYFTFASKINNYAFYVFDSGTFENHNLNNISFDSGDQSPYPIHTINQIYIGYKTSALGSINGDSVIGSISSGLGLIDDITKQFGSGFGALIWDNSKNQLTTFGNFALIFLGVSITFSIVKLCMSLIRLKTGS